MELTTGKISFRDLAEWFGLKKTYFESNSKAKARYLEKLKGFADYHFEGKKLIIDEVYIPEYDKSLKIIKKNFEKHWGENNEKWIDTCTRVGKSIYEKYPQINHQIKENTAIAYTNKVKVEFYGHTYKRDGGSRGISKYIRVREGDIPLTEQEEEIRKQCAKEAYGVLSEITVDIEEDYRNGGMTKKEYKEAIGELSEKYDCYNNYCRLLMDRLGFIPYLKTQLSARFGGYKALEEYRK